MAKSSKPTAPTDAPRDVPADSATETHREPSTAASPHGAADVVPGHASDDHGGHADHEGGELGPIDAPAWAAGAVGILLGLVVVACLVVAGSSPAA